MAEIAGDVGTARGTVEEVSAVGAEEEGSDGGHGSLEGVSG